MILDYGSPCQGLICIKHLGVTSPLFQWRSRNAGSPSLDRLPLLPEGTVGHQMPAAWLSRKVSQLTELWCLHVLLLLLLCVIKLPRFTVIL